MVWWYKIETMNKIEPKFTEQIGTSNILSYSTFKRE